MKYGKIIALALILVIGVVLTLVFVNSNSIEKDKNFQLGKYMVRSEGDGVTIVSYQGDKQDTLVVPTTIEGKKVVSISSGALNATEAKRIIFDENAKDVVIKDRAFAGHKTLEYVELPANMKYIPASCFEGCEKLKDVKIPGNIAYIGKRAFFGCTEFTKDYTKEGEIGYRVLRLPETLESIQESAFQDCSALDCVEVSSKLKTIGNSAFRKSALQRLMLNDTKTQSEQPKFGVEEIGEYAFSETYLFSESGDELLFPKLKTIGKRAFAIINTNFKHFTIPRTVTNVGEAAFTGIATLRSITFEEGGTEDITLGEYLFSDCKNLQSVAIADRVTILPKAMFMGCVSLFRYHNLILSENTSKIGEGAFAIFNTKADVQPVSYSILFRREGTNNVSYNNYFRIINLAPYYAGNDESTQNKHFIITDYHQEEKQVTKLYAYVGLYGENCYHYVDGDVKSGTFRALEKYAKIDTICEYAFAGTKIKNILIPSSVNKILDNAFVITSGNGLSAVYFNAISVEKTNFTIAKNAFNGNKVGGNMFFIIGHSNHNLDSDSALQKALLAIDNNAVLERTIEMPF